MSTDRPRFKRFSAVVKRCWLFRGLRVRASLAATLIRWSSDRFVRVPSVELSLHPRHGIAPLMALLFHVADEWNRAVCDDAALVSPPQDKGHTHEHDPHQQLQGVLQGGLQNFAHRPLHTLFRRFDELSGR